jgi:hypothetical protein
MHGAPFLYNLMLSEQLPAGEHRDALVERFRSELRGWSKRLSARREVLADWPLNSFWDFTAPLMRVTPSTKRTHTAWPTTWCG